MRIFSSKGFHPERLALEETLFHTANGYLGVRANFEEGRPEGEKSITLFADGERMMLTEDNVGDFERVLDMDTGMALRSFVWTTSAGKRLRLAVRRLASFHTRELFAVDYAVTALDGPVVLRIESSLEGDVSNYFDASDSRVSPTPFKSLGVRAVQAAPDGTLYLESRTAGTGFALGIHSCHTAADEGRGPGPATKPTVVRPAMRPVATASSPTAATAVYALSLEAGASFRLTRKTVFTDSVRHGDVAAAAERIASTIRDLSFEELVVQQASFLAAFWEGADIAIEGDPAVEEGVRYNLYQLLQAAAPDKFGNIVAEGLSGEGYEGHSFWDREIYMALFFTYSNPAMARKLLSFLHAKLGAARERAVEMGRSAGAAYPLRTIAYAYMSYYEASDDFGFIEEYGAEVLFETARKWLDIGHFKDGQFRIEAMTGSVRHACLVDNSSYTEAMARHNLLSAVRIFRELRDRSPERLRSICVASGLEEAEVAEWEKAASAMYLPHDPSLSYSVFGAMTARPGDAEKAYENLLETVRLDLDGRHGDSKDGLHTAEMGGTWMAVIFGFGGFKAQGGRISIDPILPTAWTSFSFTVRYLGRSIKVRVGRETVRIDLLTGDAIELFVHDRPALLDSRGLLIGIDGDRLSP